ncbi:hypothetical protein Poli38472_008822 [Pythium oligandrum]|uniref:Nucleotide-diphospho-sugar transferase n=1 Tax=Pythium oligandrum TaxID=41045 RepID=A0A8K1FCT7_PYTOL|nr:hypothetical protein Poli38472_008822 [Pythium oligandrum]|eukprot:TMW56174.1 hypothetical protein Poli38472_008822 [Pythium oligandrum]
MMNPARRVAYGLVMFLLVVCSLTSVVIVTLDTGFSSGPNSLPGKSVSHDERPQQLMRVASGGDRGLPSDTERITRSDYSGSDSDEIFDGKLANPDEMPEEVSDRRTDETFKPIPASASSNSQPASQANISYDKGIVLCLHDGIVAMGVSLVRELRCLGNQEVIQVYHCLNELSEASRALLTRKDLRVQIIDVCAEMMGKKLFNEKKAKSFQGYWIKPLALYHTNLTEVLVLDADVIMMRDPAVIRTTSGYQRTGTMFFYDRVVRKRVNFNKLVRVSADTKTARQYLKIWIDRFPYQRFGLTKAQLSPHLRDSLSYREETCHEQDSSIVAIDKTRAGKAFDVLWYIMTEKRFRFMFSWGDKESFWLSWEFSHTNYTFSPWAIAAVEAAHNRDFALHNTTLCGNMAHYLPEEDKKPELLYVNGKSMLEPYPKKQQFSEVFNYNPMHITPRQKRQIQPRAWPRQERQECLTGMGAVELPRIFHRRVMRRRIHAFALATGSYEWLDVCDDMLPSQNDDLANRKVHN